MAKKSKNNKKNKTSTEAEDTAEVLQTVNVTIEELNPVITVLPDFAAPTGVSDVSWRVELANRHHNLFACQCEDWSKEISSNDTHQSSMYPSGTWQPFEHEIIKEIRGIESHEIALFMGRKCSRAYQMLVEIVQKQRATLQVDKNASNNKSSQSQNQ